MIAGMAWPFDPLAQFGYDLLVVDPPWTFETLGPAGQQKSAQAHYECMPLDAIRALPVGDLIRNHGTLFLWATAPLLPAALDCLQFWGFRYKSHLVWRKVTPSGAIRMGTGYVARTMHELVLIGALGSPARMMPFPSVFDGVAREHSRKPQAFYDLVDRHAPAHLRRADIFSRETRLGWDSFGQESGKFDRVRS
jgi:N6-adenosine-specific RNA methylase IME4